MTENLISKDKKRLFIRYIAPKISGDMEAVYNAVREPNEIVLISTKRLRRLDALALKRMLLKLQRVVETSDRLIFTIEPDFYVSVPKTAKTSGKQLSDEEKRMLEEFEKIEMEEEMDDVKKKQSSYKKKIEDFVKKKNADREPLNFEVKRDGNKIGDALVSIKSPLNAKEVGNRMEELLELKSLVSGHVPEKIKTQISQKIGTVKRDEEDLREKLMNKRRKILRKLEAINDLVESSQISKDLFSRIKKQLTGELGKIDGVVVGISNKGLRVVAKKSENKSKKMEKRKSRR